MSEHRRVDTDSFKEMIANLPAGELERINQLQHEQAVDEHNRFKEHYQRDECYLCGKHFKTISKKNPCLHWLLRRCKFKSKDFSKIYQKFDYFQISSFLRWVANAERFQGNINDLLEEKDERKLFQATIKWKNIEWTFDCARNDYSGHKGRKSNLPHYHFQMRIDGKQFINYNQHHILFSEKDLFNFDLLHKKPELIYHTYGEGGSGMQDAVEVDPRDIVKHTVTSESEEDATYHLQTMIMAKDNPIKGEDLQAIIEESRNTGRTLASLVDEHFGESTEIKTIISPVDTIPDIAKRTERKRR